MSNWTKVEKKVLSASILITALLIFQQNVFAMHIMEGYLPVQHCFLWGQSVFRF